MTSSEASEGKHGIDNRLRLEFWPIERVIPSPRNARTHSDGQVAEIAGSIRTFGFTNPILVGEGGALIAGHGRLGAAAPLEVIVLNSGVHYESRGISWSRRYPG